MQWRPLLACLALLAGAAGARAEELAAGAKAPDFALQGSDGKTYHLSDFKGKQAVVLAWFPKAFTPGCTAELGALRDSAAALGSYEAAVFMVSFDAPEKNAEFAKSQGAKLVLLSDPKGEAAMAYGVAGPGGALAKRWTFYIDAEGMVREVDRNVSTATAGQDIARKLGELGIPKRP